VLLLAGSALLYGLRHGVDWDHLAAITDVTSTQETPRRGLVVATAYAAGHGLVVFVLGVVAILGRDVIPPGVDAAMGRIAGATLLVLAVAVVAGLLRDRRDFRLRSRWMLVAAGVARARRWVQHRTVEIRHDHPHDHGHGGHGHNHLEAEAPVPGSTATAVAHRHEHVHVAVVPLDPFAAPGVPTATWIGMLHGVGAETPTQVVVFLTAAHVAGGAAGVALLVCFIAGLFISNSAVAVAASFGYLSAARSFPLYATVAALNAVASAVIGTVLLTGGTLPTILGG
jgi:high-affinity nickel-transport protein